MRLLGRYLLRTFLPVFLAALTMFVLIIQLVDVFANLVRYLNLEVPLNQILRVQLLFLPQAISYALPVALLFATGFSLGSLYGNNELIAVFGAGVPIWRFVLPLLIVGLTLSLGSFLFREYVVIDTLREKNELSRRLLNITRSFSNTNVTVRSPGGSVIYSAEYYNDSTRELSRVLLVERDADGRFLRRIDAAYGRWEEGRWIWFDGTVYGADASSERFSRLDEPRFSQTPRSFQRNARDVDEMRFDEARDWIVGLREAGQPYRQALTDYYSRYSFSLTPFIVVFISSALGGRFRRNVLLMSLLLSLVSAVVYYVTGMLTGLLAGNGLIPPVLGAWAGVILFSILGIVLFQTART